MKMQVNIYIYIYIYFYKYVYAWRVAQIAMRPTRVCRFVHGGRGLGHEPHPHAFIDGWNQGLHFYDKCIHLIPCRCNWMWSVGKVYWLFFSVRHSGPNPFTSPLAITLLQASYWPSSFWSSSSSWRLDLKRPRGGSIIRRRAKANCSQHVCKEVESLERLRRRLLQDITFWVDIGDLPHQTPDFAWLLNHRIQELPQLLLGLVKDFR